MARRTSWLLGALSCLAVGYAAQQVKVNYRDQNFTLQNFDVFNATLEPDRVNFSGSGRPLSVITPEMTLSGAKAEGVAVRGANRQYFIQSTTVSGGAKAEMTSPNGPTRIQSDVLRYTGTPTEGRIEFPGSIEINSVSNTTTGPTTTAGTLRITGASGFSTIVLGAANGGMRLGELAGPVTIQVHSERRGAATEISDLDARGDSLRYDLTTSPATVTLTGNVTMNGKGPAVSGEVLADTMTVSLDPDMKPIRVDVTGSPAKTTLRQEKPGR